MSCGCKNADVLDTVDMLHRVDPRGYHQKQAKNVERIAGKISKRVSKPKMVYGPGRMYGEQPKIQKFDPLNDRPHGTASLKELDGLLAEHRKHS